MYDDNNNQRFGGFDQENTTYHYSYTPQYGSSGSGPEKPRKKRSAAGKIVALVLCCALVGGGAGVGGAALYSSLSGGGSAGGGEGITIYQNTTDPTPVKVGQADGLVNKALEVEGVRMAVLASEREDGIKMSLRAVEPDTVNDIAVLFGGGGHAQAAGCTIHDTLSGATAQVLAAMAEKLGYAGPETRA